MNNATASRYYPVDVPPLELPASQTRFPTLQPAGAFLKQMQSPYGSNSTGVHYHHQQQLKSALASDGPASPTSPSSVAVASSFLASIRRGLEDLVDDDDDEDEDDDDEGDASPRYYSASNNNNTYYSPPSSFGNQPSTTKSSSPLFSTTQSALFVDGAMAFRNPQQQANDDDLIFDMEM